MLAMVYRYLFLFAEEIYRMALAREARTVRKESCGQVLRSIGRVTGNIFIRSYEKGEQVYRAMLARGYTGEVRYVEEFKCQLRDWFLLMIILYLCGLTIFIEVV
jgi:cobalt/nickel transport system permease protein